MYKICSRCGKVHDRNYKCGGDYTGKYSRCDAEKIRYTRAWQKKAQAIKEESGFLCAVCYDAGVINHKDLEVHHIEKLRSSPQKAFLDDNLICLCRICHRKADKGLIPASYLKRLALERQKKLSPLPKK